MIIDLLSELGIEGIAVYYWQNQMKKNSIKSWNTEYGIVQNHLITNSTKKMHSKCNTSTQSGTRLFSNKDRI